jgi:VIT1/CCC1 family predicted Fe2+/Mn2+ transporter
VLFGLIMVLTFTGSLSVTAAGREDIHAMLIGALGCNIAWGVIDGVFYLMGCLAERGRDQATYRAVLQATSPIEARRLIADVLPPVLASAIAPAEFDRIRQRLVDVGAPPEVARLTGADWRGAVAVFLLVFLSTLPVTVPFIVLENPMAAIRASNAVAIVMLFAAGVAYGRVVERSRWMLGIAMVLLGAGLVAFTIVLGG